MNTALNRQNLIDSTVIVTGASRGLGREMCIALAMRGAAVVAAARSLDRATRGAGTLLDTAAAIREKGGKVHCSVVDVRDAEAVAHLFDQAEAAFGRVDTLVNNAGLMVGEVAFEHTDPDLWRKVLDTNLLGAYHCCHQAVPRMLANGGGVIVNVTSGAAVRAGFLNQPYGVSKAGLDRLTLGLAAEFRDRNIACIGLSPSISDTGTVRQMYPDRDPDTFAQPPDWPARALCALLENDPMSYSGQVLSVRQYLFDQGLIPAPPSTQ